MGRRIPLGNLVVGALTAALGGAIVMGSAQLPTMFGFNYGPGFFPGLVGAALLAVGFVQAATAFVGPASPAGEAKARQPLPQGAIVRPVALLAIVVIFAYAMPRVGFHLTAPVALFLSTWLFGVRPVVAAPLALALVLLMDAVFRALLLVPLPWGVLTEWSGSLAWRF